jgi:hypothetical protein
VRLSDAPTGLSRAHLKENCCEPFDPDATLAGRSVGF